MPESGVSSSNRVRHVSCVQGWGCQRLELLFDYLTTDACIEDLMLLLFDACRCPRRSSTVDIFSRRFALRCASISFDCDSKSLRYLTSRVSRSDGRQGRLPCVWCAFDILQSIGATTNGYHPRTVAFLRLFQHRCRVSSNTRSFIRRIIRWFKAQRVRQLRHPRVTLSNRDHYAEMLMHWIPRCCAFGRMWGPPLYCACLTASARRQRLSQRCATRPLGSAPQPA